MNCQNWSSVRFPYELHSEKNQKINICQFASVQQTVESLASEVQKFRQKFSSKALMQLTERNWNQLSISTKILGQRESDFYVQILWHQNFDLKTIFQIPLTPDLRSFPASKRLVNLLNLTNFFWVKFRWLQSYYKTVARLMASMNGPVEQTLKECHLKQLNANLLVQQS